MEPYIKNKNNNVSEITYMSELTPRLWTSSKTIKNEFNKVRGEFVLRFAQDSMDDSEQSEESCPNNLRHWHYVSCGLI